MVQASQAKDGRKAVALRLPGREPLQCFRRWRQVAGGLTMGAYHKWGIRDIIYIILHNLIAII